MISHNNVLFFLLVLFCNNPVDCFAGNDYRINTESKIAVPVDSHKFLYTLHAKSAVVKQSSPGSFQLILEDVFEMVNYSNKENNSENDLVNISDFIKMWRSANSKKIVQVDMTGVQVDNKTIGHTQFYATALLGNPVYYHNERKLIFKSVSFMSKVDIRGYARFDNATLFINGRDIFPMK